jgi:hypothetical protein
MAKSTTGESSHPRASEEPVDPRVAMFARWMHEADLAEKSPPHRGSPLQRTSESPSASTSAPAARAESWAPDFLPQRRRSRWKTWLTEHREFAALFTARVRAAAGRAARGAAPPRAARRLTGIAAVMAVVVAITVAALLWPNQLQQLVTQSEGSSTGASPSRAASPLPSAPTGDDPADVTDALTPARASAGVQLSENPALRVGPAAEALLVGGRVDARLILVLGLVLSDHTLTIADFPQGDGSVTDLRNSVLITELDGSDLATSAQARVDATSLLLAFTSIAAPTRVTMTSDGVLALFDGLEPPGLLPTPAASSPSPAS